MGSAPCASGRRPILAVVLAVVLALASAATACSGGPDDQTGTAPQPIDPAVVVAEAEAAATQDVVAALAAGDGEDGEDGEDGDADGRELDLIDALEIAGEIINEYSLSLGECFNRLEGLQSGRKVEITSRVGCAEPHVGEVFHVFALDVEHPGIYPGDDTMRRYALRVCYEQFETFVGEEYELSVYEIGVFTPTRTNFEDDVARYRGVHCWLYDVDGEPLFGTAAGTAR